MRRPSSQKVENQELAVQELTVRFEDANLYTVASGVYTIHIDDTVAAAVSVLMLDDSAGTYAPVAAANITLVNTTDDRGNTITNGGIQLASLSAPLAAHDSLVVKYITTN